MYTLDLRTNESRLDSLFRGMTADIPVKDDWQAKLRYRRLYHFEAPAGRPKVVAKRKVAWDRVVLLLVAIACVATYQSNSNVAKQYQVDRQTAYQSLNLK